MSQTFTKPDGWQPGWDCCSGSFARGFRDCLVARPSQTPQQEGEAPHILNGSRRFPHSGSPFILMADMRRLRWQVRSVPQRRSRCRQSWLYL
jgi:hypothetical protein